MHDDGEERVARGGGGWLQGRLQVSERGGGYQAGWKIEWRR